LWFCASGWNSGKKNPQKKREPRLTRHLGPEKPTRKDKSKAHAVWREHLAYYSFSGSLNEISQVSVTRTIAKCYVNILIDNTLSIYFFDNFPF